MHVINEISEELEKHKKENLKKKKEFHSTSRIEKIHICIEKLISNGLRKLNKNFVFSEHNMGYIPYNMEHIDKSNKLRDLEKLLLESCHQDSTLNEFKDFTDEDLKKLLCSSIRLETVLNEIQNKLNIEN